MSVAVGKPDRAQELGLSEEDAVVLDLYERFFSREVPPAVVREAEPGGFAPRVWSQLHDTGFLDMALDKGPQTLRRLGWVARTAGSRAAPVPVVETAVAARLLSRSSKPTAREWLDRVSSGAIVSFAPLPLDRRRLAPAGSCADAVICLADDTCLLLEAPAHGFPPARANLGAAALSELTVDLAEFGTRLGPRQLFDHAVEEWRGLNAASLLGLGQGALALGSEYAAHREQFGRPIGSFQGLAHPLADCLAELDGAGLLVEEALAALAWGDPDGSTLVAMARCAAAEAAAHTAATCLHVHGGYGLALEYDVQLYFRRAKAWALVGGDPNRALESVGKDLLITDRDMSRRQIRSLPIPEDLESFRQELLDFMDEELTPDVVNEDLASGDTHHWGFHRALAKQGWVAASWPVCEGGADLGPWGLAVLREESRRLGAPCHGSETTILVADVLKAQAQAGHQPLLERFASGDLLISLGYTEPDAGSDVAAVSTRADWDGDEWALNGQKMFTTFAHLADYVFLLTRTNHDVPRHAGLTFFLVPLDSPGVEIRPIRTVGGERTNALFLNDVRVADAARVGPVDGAWGILTEALNSEHSGFNGLGARLLDACVSWARGVTLPDGTPAEEDSHLRARLGRVAMHNAQVRLQAYRDAAVIEATGVAPAVESALNKLNSAELLVEDCSDMLDLLGADGLLSLTDAAPEPGQVVEFLYRFSVGTRIYGGSSQIMRSLIAERGLGLPRSR